MHKCADTFYYEIQFSLFDNFATFIHLGCSLPSQFFFSLGLETFCCVSQLGVEVPEFISPDSDNSPCKGPKWFQAFFLQNVLKIWKLIQVLH